MTDTQWSTYEVFIQDRPERLYRNAGSVHAVDPEMAVLNARTVFVRRPACHSLWVVPAASILARTAEELEDSLPDVTDENVPEETYHVFRKTNQRRGITYVDQAGEVEASSPEAALRAALEAFPERPVYVWWVFQASAITATGEEDIDSLFAPAREKTYRQQSQYRTTL